LVLDAVVLKEVVEVALVLVLFERVTLASVEEPVTKRLESEPTVALKMEAKKLVEVAAVEVLLVTVRRLN